MSRILKPKGVSVVRAEYDTTTRGARVYVCVRELNVIGYDVLLPSSLAETYILHLLDDADWSSTHCPAIRDLALV